MEIFNKQIFGSDAEEWLQLPTMQQVEWIKSNTNQQSDDLIDEFLSNLPTLGKEKECLNCGKDGDFSKGISKEVATDTITELSTGESTENSTKRSKKSETRKN